ncbi:acetyltransferase domain-containing protein [Nemania sp. NC0429]|nr:acetyltransferase domain-containing protein [Nemania sp. NC0429]
MASPNLPESTLVPPPAPAQTSAEPKIKVKTTWPVVAPRSSRTPIRTERLLLCPFDAAHAEAVFELRRQPEVMLWTRTGVPDADLAESRAFVERFLPPKDLETYNFVALYLGDEAEGNANSEGVLVGVGGAHRIQPEAGWPEVGYMFRKEYWGKGLGTEFLRAFTKAYWALPRSEIELEIDAALVGKTVEVVEGKGEGGKNDDAAVVRVPEVLMAVIDAENKGSGRILEKAGFKEVKTWSEPDSRAAFAGANVGLIKFHLEAPGS